MCESVCQRAVRDAGGQVGNWGGGAVCECPLSWYSCVLFRGGMNNRDREGMRPYRSGMSEHMMGMAVLVDVDGWGERELLRVLVAFQADKD